MTDHINEYFNETFICYEGPGTYSWTSNSKQDTMPAGEVSSIEELEDFVEEADSFLEYKDEHLGGSIKKDKED